MNTNNTSNPPFRIGQKVVVVEDAMPGFGRKVVVKGETFTIRKSYGVCVFLNEITNSPHPSFSPLDGYEPAYPSKYFAPIEENKERIRYVAVSETLREKAEEVVVESCNLS